MNANKKQVGGEHYRGAAYQHWDWCVENNLGYLEGQVTKYLSRWRKKNGRQDLEKALHYAEKLVEVGYLRCTQKPYRLNRVKVKGLPLMTQLYELSPAEADVFRLVTEYQTVEELTAVRRICEELLTTGALHEPSTCP